MPVPAPSNPPLPRRVALRCTVCRGPASCPPATSIHPKSAVTRPLPLIRSPVEKRLWPILCSRELRRRSFRQRSEHGIEHGDSARLVQRVVGVAAFG